MELKKKNIIILIIKLEFIIKLDVKKDLNRIKNLIKFFIYFNILKCDEGYL